MQQSVRATRMVWTIGVVVLVVSVVFGEIATSRTNGINADGGTRPTQEYTYRGPSQDYLTAPHPWSLTYANPGSDYYVRDMDRHRRWEDEQRKDDHTATPEWAHTQGITIAAD